MMSELDLDIRAVSSASNGARLSSSDVNQIQASANDQSSAAGTIQRLPDGGAATVRGAATQPTFRYDSFRFVYQTGYGRIVLVDQNPETGKAISQIPSERALQIYAEQKRSEVLAASSDTANTSVTVQTNAGTAREFGADHQTTGGNKIVSTPAVAHVASVSSPVPDSTPSPAFIAHSAAPVNITI